MGGRFLRMDASVCKVGGFHLPFSSVVYGACDSDDRLKELAISLKTLKMEKSIVGWDLEMLEAATHEVQNRDDDSDDESNDS
jgi:hypothetical protein